MSYWKWLGKNEFVPGVPARDLTDEEVDRRGIRDLVELSPLYEFVGHVPEAESEEEGE
jgi:hypothetical protein